MPALFSEQDYKVTVVDPPYANYNWIPDLTLFEGMEGVDAYLAEGVVRGDHSEIVFDAQNNKRNIFCLSLMKTMPLCLQPVVYDNGQYNQTEQVGHKTDENVSKSTGFDKVYMDRYAVITGLAGMTEITDSDTNTFLCMTSNLTHDPILMQTPDYVPADKVDNTQYDAEHAGRFTLDGKTLKVETSAQMAHYHGNMSTLLRLGEWFDYLREQGVYDNTRIILVSDHGRALDNFAGMYEKSESGEDVSLESYLPLLMVKDFESDVFTTSNDFMTNADVPTLALQGLIENPVNPFTGKPVTDEAKGAHEQLVLVSHEYDVTVNNGNAFLAGRWLSVSGDALDPESWKLLDEATVLKEHEIPE